MIQKQQTQHLAEKENKISNKGKNISLTQDHITLHFMARIVTGY